MMKLLSAGITNFNGTVQLPLSKSESNRYLILNALSKTAVGDIAISDSDDTAIMLHLLNSTASELDCGAAGTTFRFLTAYFACQEGAEKVLTGSERMKDRPVKPLVDVLNKLGASVTYMEKEGFPPLKIHGKKIRGGQIEIDSSVSSQFISALLLVGNSFEYGLQLKLTGEGVSQSYIQLTIEMLRESGIEVSTKNNFISLKPGQMDVSKLNIGSDWSSAGPWYQMVAFAEEAELYLPGLSLPSFQGDSAIVQLFEKLGVSTMKENSGIRIKKNSAELPDFLEIDCTSNPDLVPYLAVTAAAMGVRMLLTGVQHLRIKESDRLESITSELAKFRIKGVVNEKGLLVDGKITMNNAKVVEIDTHDDHRIAMAFAPLVVSLDKILIKNPEVVSKSYPKFWTEMAKFINIKHLN